MFSASSLTFATLLIWGYVTPVLAQGGGATCNISSPCPSTAPCCSEFGFCGSGAGFCLGGCNPLSSHTPASCEPLPLCKSAKYNFQDNSRILLNGSHYNGNASQYDWVVDKGNVQTVNTTGTGLALTLTQQNGGTRISSTRYMHYGTLTARMKTGKWQGVVTAFITMSDAKDEIDWEWPGNQITQAQTNFYWLGVANYTHGQTISNLNDTSSNFHDYTIDWQPDVLRFLIDGKVVRSVSKSDLQSQFPSTPARAQLSIWPAGINTSAPGTVQWAGGMINWNDPDYVAAGHFYTIIQSVSINCSDPAGSVPPGAQSYVYGPNVTEGGVTSPGVLVTNQSTIMNGAPRMVGVSAWTYFLSLVFGGSFLVFLA